MLFRMPAKTGYYARFNGFHASLGRFMLAIYDQTHKHTNRRRVREKACFQSRFKDMHAQIDCLVVDYFYSKGTIVVRNGIVCVGMVMWHV